MTHPPMRVPRRGFTLIELLVVISIISILLAVLLPAIGEIRRSARIARGLSNMKQHAIGAAAFSAAHKGRLLHGPEGRSGNLRDPVGIRGRPARLFAAQDHPTNGWGFPGLKGQQGFPVFFHINPRFGDQRQPSMASASMFDFYIPQLGPYIVEGEGMSMLQDVFLSAADSKASVGWDRWRRLVRENNGKLRDPIEVEMREVTVGSYRYSPSLMVSASSLGSRVTPGNRLQERALLIDLRDSRKWGWNYEDVVFNVASSVSHPSKKVSFFLMQAFHDTRAVMWVEESARHIPVALVDGSARSTSPFQEGFYGCADERSGPTYRLASGRAPPGGGVAIAAKDYMPNGFMMFSDFRPDTQKRCGPGEYTGYRRGLGYPGHFFMTMGGVRGRDLGTP